MYQTRNCVVGHQIINFDTNLSKFPTPLLELLLLLMLGYVSRVAQSV